MLCFTTEASGRQEEAGFLPTVLSGPVLSLILFPGELLHGNSDSHSAISLAPGPTHPECSVRKSNPVLDLFMRVSLSSVQSLSHIRLFVTPWTAACQASLSITNSWSLLRFMSIESVMPCKHLILCLPLLLPSIFPSIRVFSNESVLCIRWPKYWSFIFSISPSNEYSGLMSFRMDWLDFLAVQGTLKSLLQHHSSKASILLLSAFFTVQLLHPYMTTGKTIALTRWRRRIGGKCWQSNVLAF